MNNLLWSVTIPTYNAAKFLAETLNSVLSQEIPADLMEIIIVDNCSTDETIEIAREIGKDRIKIIVNDVNIGMFGNFNKCIEVANGSLIHLLNADDIIKPGFYQEIGKVSIKYPEIYFFCCNSELINEQGILVGKAGSIKTFDKPSKNIAELAYANPFLTPAVVVRREAYRIVGGFDAHFSFVADWEMWARIIFNLGGVCVDEVLAQYRIHEQSGTAALNATGSSILDYERIYDRFLLLGYPIDKGKVAIKLRELACDSYIKYYYLNNFKAADSMLGLYKRRSSILNALFFAAKVGLRRKVGIIKRILK